MFNFKNNKSNTKNTNNESILEVNDTSNQLHILRSQFSKYSRLIENLDSFHIKMLQRSTKNSYIFIGTLILTDIIILGIGFFSKPDNMKILVTVFNIIFTVTIASIYKILDNRSSQSKTIFDTKKGYLDKLIELDLQLQNIEHENSCSTDCYLDQRQQRINDLIEKIAE